MAFRLPPLSRWRRRFRLSLFEEGEGIRNSEAGGENRGGCTTCSHLEDVITTGGRSQLPRLSYGSAKRSSTPRSAWSIAAAVTVQPWARPASRQALFSLTSPGDHCAGVSGHLGATLETSRRASSSAASTIGCSSPRRGRSSLDRRSEGDRCACDGRVSSGCGSGGSRHRCRSGAPPAAATGCGRRWNAGLPSPTSTGSMKRALIDEPGVNACAVVEALSG